MNLVFLPRKYQLMIVSAIIKSVAALDAIRWLKASWDEINENTIHNCVQECGFSQVNSMTGKTQGNSEL